MLGARSSRFPLWLISGSVLIVVVGLFTLSHRLGYLSLAHIRPLSSSVANQSWSFDTLRDANNYGLSSEQCDRAFPGLFDEIDRVVRQRRGKRITRAELTRDQWPAGTVRALIWEQQVCSNSFPDHDHQGIVTLLRRSSTDIRP
jgi:hypothetical protein